MRSRQAIAAGILVAGTLMAWGGPVVAQDGSDDSQVFTLVERATTDAVIYVTEDGVDSPGDMLTFGNELFDAANETVVGRDQGQCFRTNVGLAWECIWTNIIDSEGSITVQGPFYDDLRDSDLAITGGTGTYANAGGWMTLHSQDDAGLILEFTFNVDLDDDAVGDD